MRNLDHKKEKSEAREAIRREARKKRAQAELALTKKRRAHRSINDRCAYALRNFYVPDLTTPDAIALAHANIQNAYIAGAFDVRKVRVMLRALRIALMAVKHTKGPMFAEGYTPPLFRPPTSKSAPRDSTRQRKGALNDT